MLQEMCIVGNLFSHLYIVTFTDAINIDSIIEIFQLQCCESYRFRFISSAGTGVLT